MYLSSVSLQLALTRPAVAFVFLLSLKARSLAARPLRDLSKDLGRNGLVLVGRAIIISTVNLDCLEGGADSRDF